MNRRLVLATRNAGKVGELRIILAEVLEQLDVELVGMDAFPDVEDVVESGVTFEENALLKARAAAEATGLPAVADDSGLAVDVLGGAPGIFSARWAGRHGEDVANYELLLAQVFDVPDEHRSAAFVCCAALAMPDGRSVTREACSRASRGARTGSATTRCSRWRTTPARAPSCPRRRRTGSLTGPRPSRPWPRSCRVTSERDQYPKTLVPQRV